MKKFLLLTIIVSSFVLSACNATHKSSVSPTQFKNNFKTIIVRDVYAEEGLRHKQDEIAYIQSKVEDALNQRGYTLLPENVYMDMLDLVSEERGGLINTVTGKRDQAKYKAAVVETFKRLREDYAIDGVLHTELQVRKASFGNYRAKWDGQEEPYELNNSDMSNFLSTLVVNTGGTMPAVSLMVFLHDNQNNQIYLGAGGIQLLAKVDDDDEFVDIPDSQLMADKTKIDFAFNEAFRKLIDVKSQ